MLSRVDVSVVGVDHQLLIAVVRQIGLSAHHHPCEHSYFQGVGGGEQKDGYEGEECDSVVWLVHWLEYNINYEIIVKGGEVGRRGCCFGLQKNCLSSAQISHLQSLWYSICYAGVLTGPEDRKATNAYPLFHTPIVNPTFSVALDLI